MGYTNDEELRPSSPDADETLPLYEESQRDRSMELEPLDSSAAPDEVRDFLVQVMQSRGIGLDHARRVASRWTLGTGRELRSYPVAMYRDIFGPEDGWVVYKEVRILYYKKENEKNAFWRWVWLSLLVAALALLVVCIVAINTGYGDETWFVFAMFGLIPTGCAVLIFATLMFAKSDPEKRAEQELKNEWYKAPGPQARTN